MKLSCAPAPNAIQFFISSSGASAAMFSVMRFCISATRCSFSALTSGRPRNARASAGVHSISSSIFMALSSFFRRELVTSAGQP